VILEKLGERVEILEEELVAQTTPSTLKEIHSLKREMIFLRKGRLAAAGSDRGPGAGESPLIRNPSASTFGTSTITPPGDRDHRTIRDMVSGMLDIYLSSISNRSMRSMKVCDHATILSPDLSRQAFMG